MTVSNALQKKAEIVRSGGSNPSVVDYIAQQKKSLERQLPIGVDADKWFAVLLNEFKKNPKLLECSKDTVLKAVSVCSQLGLEIGDGQGLAYLIPYGHDCVLVVGYQGYIELAARAGWTIIARSVYENDEFICNLGENHCSHIPALKDRGQEIAWYAIATKDNQKIIHFMSLDEVNQHKKFSKAKGPSSPWETSFGKMARKSVVREMVPYIPMCTALNTAYNTDESSNKNEVYVPMETIETTDESSIEDAQIVLDPGEPLEMAQEEFTQPLPAQDNSKRITGTDKTRLLGFLKALGKESDPFPYINKILVDNSFEPIENLSHLTVLQLSIVSRQIGIDLSANNG